MQDFIKKVVGRVSAGMPLVQMEDREFQTLAGLCGHGDADAMLGLSKYLQNMYPEEEKTSGVWLLRAAIYGNKEAQLQVLDKIAKSRDYLEQLVIPYKNFIPGQNNLYYKGEYPGVMLNAIGLLAFEPDETYLLSGITKERVMVLWKNAGYESPDEDGFGAEDYYDMFCLDEFYQPLEGVSVVTCVSAWDIRHMPGMIRYERMIHEMHVAVQSRKKCELWMDFLPKAENTKK